MNKTINVENCTRLAEYLESLPEDYDRFTMETFFMKADGREPSLPTLNPGPAMHVCGTAACAIGHGPAAGVPVGRATSWMEYSENFAPVLSNEWDWMFAASWNDVDDTHRGAAARIRYLLDGNEVPEGFYCNLDAGERYQPYLK